MRVTRNEQTGTERIVSEGDTIVRVMNEERLRIYVTSISRDELRELLPHLKAFCDTGRLEVD